MILIKKHRKRTPLNTTAESDFIDILAQAASNIGIILSDQEKALFQSYRRELMLWNSKTNLVSIKTPFDLPIKHCIDSLLAAPFIGNREGALLDIGTGAGLPGIPLKIIFPSLAVTLLDSHRKKTSFLQDVIAKLHLEKISVIRGRVELLAADTTYAARFDTVISRAVFSLADFLEIGSRFLNEQGSLIAMKGRGLQEELKDALAVAEKKGLRMSGCHEVRLPILDDLRIIAVFTKR